MNVSSVERGNFSTERLYEVSCLPNCPPPLRRGERLVKTVRRQIFRMGGSAVYQVYIATLIVHRVVQESCLQRDVETSVSNFYICGASGGSFVPLGKGDAAFFAAGGLEFTAEDPLWSPFSRGTKVSRTKALASPGQRPGCNRQCGLPPCRGASTRTGRSSSATIIGPNPGSSHFQYQEP